MVGAGHAQHFEQKYTVPPSTDFNILSWCINLRHTKELSNALRKNTVKRPFNDCMALPNDTNSLETWHSSAIRAP